MSLVLLSASAHAQRTPDALAPPSRPSAATRSYMAMAGVAVSAASLGFAATVGSGEMVLLAPLASGMAVNIAGDLRGYDGNGFATLGGAVVGGAVGVGLIVLHRDALIGEPSRAEIAGFLVGAASYVVLPSIGATIGYTVSVRPAAVTTQDGTAVPGATLRVGL
ncbi:MAG: hypothetical protein AAGJ11_01070 [Bacteroidota bacterium]